MGKLICIQISLTYFPPLKQYLLNNANENFHFLTQLPEGAALSPLIKADHDCVTKQTHAEDNPVEALCAKFVNWITLYLEGQKPGYKLLVHNLRQQWLLHEPAQPVNTDTVPYSVLGSTVSWDTLWRSESNHFVVGKPSLQKGKSLMESLLFSHNFHCRSLAQQGCLSSFDKDMICSPVAGWAADSHSQQACSQLCLNTHTHVILQDGTNMTSSDPCHKAFFASFNTHHMETGAGKWSIHVGDILQLLVYRHKITNHIIIKWNVTNIQNGCMKF